MLRRSIIAAITSILLPVGMLTAAPTSTAEARFDNSIGVIKAPDQRYQGRGCHSYRIRWNFNPPNEDWTVFMRMRSPRGFSIRTELWDPGAERPFNQEVGRTSVKLCSPSVRPGRYKIEMQMAYNTGPSGSEVAYVNRAPTYFRLIRR